MQTAREGSVTIVRSPQVRDQREWLGEVVAAVYAGNGGRIDRPCVVS